MTALNRTEMLVLGQLSSHMFGDGKYINKITLRQRLSFDLSTEHLDIILRYLHAAGLAEQSQIGGEVVYKASDAGNAAVKATGGIIGREESARLRSRVEKLAETYSLPRAQSRSIDWGKWGALASMAAIPIAILLWWLSHAPLR